ncbi:hypothetical protein G9A89_009414 [Geosiphon pyriformis]|nr:hypothetical protein G9A89_009414 [Geosiphon pyriformis]
MADEATKTPIGKINDLPIKINSIIVSIKVLVMEATQYQALVGNDWLSKTNTTLNWNTQELQLSQNGLYALIAARNCHQWAHAVVMMRNTIPQQSSTVIHAYSNALDDQRGKKNGITNLVLLVGRSC